MSVETKKKQPDTVAPGVDLLAGLAAFATVMDQGSFTSAAKILGISKSEVSKRVAALEERLGVRLLHRSTRKLSPTEAGVAVHERASRMVDEAQGARSVARGYHAAVQGTLRVNGPVVFGQLHLAPLIPVFLEKYSDVKIELTLTDAFIDPVAERQDITVRIARLADTSLLARKICDDRRVVVASPAYLAARGTPTHPRQLMEHECIRYMRLNARDEWRFKDPEDGREFSVEPGGRFSSDSGVASRLCAEAGMGFAILPQFIVQEAIDVGKLVPVLNDYLLSGHGIYALYHPGRQVSPAVRAFLNMLSERVGKR